MLQRKFRLPASIHFFSPRVFKDSLFLLKAQDNSLSYSRFGFIVGKTIDKRAVVRNRLKRQLRSCMEEKWIEELKGRDLLFILRPSILHAERQSIQQAVDKYLSQLI